MPALDLVIAAVIVPSALIVLMWCYFILRKAASGEVSFRSVIAIGLFVASAKAIAMAVGYSEPRPSWALALLMLCLAAWILRLLHKFGGNAPARPTAWDQLI